MAPRKNKNKIIHVGESSAAASKRRRIELLKGKTTATFTNPIAEFPSIPLPQQQPPNPPTGLQLSPPSAIPQRQDEEDASDDDDALSSLIPQQNFIINYHMLQSVNEFWRSNFAEEVRKRKDREASLKQKEEMVDRFRQMYRRGRVFWRICFSGGWPVNAAAAAIEEEVDSCFVDLNSVASMDMVCKNCRSRPATMLWLPCRHLCVCLVCEKKVKICPICGVEKTESFMINLSSPS